MPTRLLCRLAVALITLPAAGQVIDTDARSVGEAVIAATEELNRGAASGRSATAATTVSFASANKMHGLGDATHHRFRQLGPGGYPVVGSHLIVHEFRNALKTTSSAVPADRFPPGPQIIGLTADAARERAEREVTAGRYRPADVLDATELVWVPRGLDFVKAPYRLAYRVDVYAADPVAREYVYVDANSGEVVAREPRILHTEEPGTAETRYHGNQEIITDRLDSIGYRLYQAEARGTVIHTRNYRNGGGPDFEEFTDDDNAWTGRNERQDEVARDAYWASGQYHDLLSELLGYHSIDDAGYPLICNVHVDSNLVNAYWDGRMSYYGDGSPESRLSSPLTAIDIVAHEFTHGLTQFSAGLIYASESGALNESFSDIYGVATRLMALPERAGDYSIGSDVDETGRGIRSMSDPNAFDDPDTYEGDHYYAGSEDRGGVHTNSGVQNHWFYLLAEGGSGTNDHGRPYAVAAIGWEDALRVAHETLTGYLTPSSTYPEAAEASVAAAESLFGVCDARTASVAAAWAAVGLPVSTAANGLIVAASQTSSCDPAKVFTLRASVREGVEVIWDLGDGSRATGAVVEHSYGAVGTYEVIAYATDCEGRPDTARLGQPIVVDPDATRCSAFPMPNQGQLVVEACAGLVTHAEQDAPYSNHVNSRLLVDQWGASEGFRLVVESFELEHNFDYLAISEVDPRGDSTLVGRFTGTDLRPGDTLIVNAPQIAFDFATDGSVVAPGFAIAFEALGAADIEPVAAVQVADTNSPQVVSRPVAFRSEGAIGSLTYDFGDGTVGRGAADEAAAHSYASPGDYVVRQVARTCAGRDTAYTTVTVSAGSKACISADTTYLTLDPGQTGLFVRSVENCGDGPLYVAPGTRRLSTTFLSTRHLAREDATYHSFAALPDGGADSLVAELRVRYAGDFDEDDEYLTISVGFERFELRDDGNPRNGSPLEAVVPIPERALRDIHSRGVYVETYGSSGVEDHVAGFRSVLLTFDHYATTVATESEAAIEPQATFDVAVAVPTTGLPPGLYLYTEGLTATDTSLSGGRLGIPVALTVDAADRLTFRDEVIDLGEVYAGTTSYPSARLRNRGADEAIVGEVEVSAGLHAEITLAEAVEPGADAYVYLRHRAPAKAGPFEDSLRVRSTSGTEAVLIVRGEVTPPGELRPIADSTRLDTAVAGFEAERSLLLHNDGLGPLECRLSISSRDDLIRLDRGNYQRFTILPNDSLSFAYAIDAREVRGGSTISAEVQVYLPESGDRVEVPLEVYALPGAYARIEAPSRTCGGEVELASWSQGEGLTHTWTLGDGFSVQGRTVRHAYSADGEYEVSLIVCDELRCDTSTARIAVTIDCDDVVLDGDHPREMTACDGRLSGFGRGRDTTGYGAGFSTVVKSPAGTPLSFTFAEFADDYWSEVLVYEGQGEGARLLANWDRYTRLGSTLTVESGVATVAWRPDFWSDEAGFAIDFACEDPIELAGFARRDDACVSSARFGAYAPQADTYRWSFGDGGRDSVANTSHIYARAGVYRAVVHASGPDGYADSLAVDVVIAEAPALRILTLDDAEAGLPLTFSVAGELAGGEPVVWSTSDGQAAAGSLVQLTFPDSGAYLIEATALLANGCPARATYPVAVRPQPTSEAESDPGSEGDSSGGADPVSAVTEASGPALAVVPNPARGRAEIRLAAPAVAIALRDGFGRVVVRPEPAARAVTLDLESLPDGFYTVEVRYADGSSAAARLLVQN